MRKLKSLSPHRLNQHLNDLAILAQNANDRTKTACIILDGNNKPLANATNWVEWAVPQNSPNPTEHISRLWNDPEFRNHPQHQFFHAEEQAVENIRIQRDYRRYKELNNLTCITLFNPCEDCAEQLLQIGVSRVIFFQYHKPKWDTLRQQRLIRRFREYRYIHPEEVYFSLPIESITSSEYEEKETDND